MTTHMDHYKTLLGSTILDITPKKVITSSTLVEREKAILWVIEQQPTPGTLTSKMLIEKFPSPFKANGKNANYTEAGVWIK